MITSKAYKSLGLLRRVLKNSYCPEALYISIVRPNLLYCSPLWRPYQRRATKFILSDYSSDYKTRLIQLGMLPLMYILEIADIVFFIKSINNPSEKFNILDFVDFSAGSSRSANMKLHHKTARTNITMNSYFYCLSRLWNHLPIIDLSRPLDEIKIEDIFGITFKIILILTFFVVFITFVLVPIAPSLLPLMIIILFFSVYIANYSVHNIFFIGYQAAAGYW